MMHRILDLQRLDESVNILKLERKNLVFQPGQYIHLGIPHEKISREYSIYSSIHEDFIEILFRKIDSGALTPWLSDRRSGDRVELQGPFGEFLLSEEQRKQKMLFIATGTGISPFHSYVKSFHGLDYRLIHGIPHKPLTPLWKETFSDRYIPCFSRQAGEGFHGRVTHWLEQQGIGNAGLFMICGNTDMIYQVFSILERQGIERSNIKVETYY